MKELLTEGDSIPINRDLCLSPISMAMAEELYALSDANREYLSKWLPWIDHTRSVDDTRAFIKSSSADLFSGKFALAVLHRGKLAGVCDFKGKEASRTLEIGYWLGEEFTGKGIMTKACRAMIQFAFEKSEANRIVIKCATGNFKSQQIPHRLGFLKEGVERESIFLNGKYHDLNVNSLLRNEWVSSPAQQEFLKSLEVETRLAVAS